MKSRREILRAIIVLCLIWIAVTVVLARWQKGSPPLLHYPGTESMPEQTVPNMGTRRYTFALHEDYPSLTAFRWYQQALAARGWKPLFQGEPGWRREVRGDTAQDVFTALWVSPNRVYQLQLQLLSTAKLTRAGDRVISETREPGLYAVVSQQRSMGPWLLEQEKKEQPPSIQIKGKGQ